LVISPYQKPAAVTAQPKRAICDSAGLDSLGGSAFRHQRVNFLDELFLQLFHIVDVAGHEILR